MLLTGMWVRSFWNSFLWIQVFTIKKCKLLELAFSEWKNDACYEGRTDKDEPCGLLPWASVAMRGRAQGFCLDFSLSFQLCLQTQATAASVPT